MGQSDNLSQAEKEWVCKERKYILPICNLNKLVDYRNVKKTYLITMFTTASNTIPA
jgi:hypothetical protein